MAAIHLNISKLLSERNVLRDYKAPIRIRYRTEKGSAFDYNNWLS